MTWGSVLPVATAGQAVAVARAVAHRLAAPESLPPLPDRPGLLRDGASGAAGCAVLLSRFDGGEWERAAHRCLTVAVRELEHADVRRPGMFDGLTGSAFGALLLSRDGTRYQRLLAELDRGIVRDATSRAAVLAHARRGLPFESFDLVSGVTGTGAYLLRRNAYPAALRAALTGLVAVCRWETDLPNWHTPAWSMAPKTPMAESFPGGVLNCGLAHGVPGPLALLSLAELSGVSVAGQREAIAVVGHWLAAHRADDAHGPNWPTGIPLPGTTAVETRPRNAWCYGGPGGGPRPTRWGGPRPAARAGAAPPAPRQVEGGRRALPRPPPPPPLRPNAHGRRAPAAPARPGLVGGHLLSRPPPRRRGP
ncbi:lanthionine synthetase LanC family protein, partial [Nocardia brasiliensis]|uniref:lanthionine synthetase LanC family protein n=1 Tax=Nocardia brasiliensis TaxID=37326 RepID=UPI0024569406